MLFVYGADIRQGQLLYNTVLRDGPEHEVIELVELLLGKGATINEIQYKNHPQTFVELQDFSLGTPLHYAAQAGKEMVVSYLLNKGADPLIRNTKGRTVIKAARYTNQLAVVQMLSHV
jgi:ankyrin repeat protein